MISPTLLEKVNTQQPIMFTNRNVLSLWFNQIWLFKAYDWVASAFCCFFCCRGRDKNKPSSCLCFALDEVVFATYLKGIERLHKDYDAHKLAKKVKMHSIALKTSVLCAKERR